MMDFGTFAKIAYNVGDLGKIILAAIFKWLPKVQKIAQSGYIDHRCNIAVMLIVRFTFHT